MRRSATSILLDGLRRIGIDEISHRKGQRYLTVVVDHDSGRLVWAAAGRVAGPSRCSSNSSAKSAANRSNLVSCDMAGWIAGPVADRLPDAVRAAEVFLLAPAGRRRAQAQ